jgi:type IV pilus assembly protein PilM
MRIVVVAARRAMVDGFVAAARTAGLRPMGIDLDAFALVRALAPDTPSSEHASVYCHLGGVTNLAVAAGRLCLFSRPLEARADGETVPTGRLAEEIRLSIDTYGALPDSPPVERVVLSGPGASHDGLAPELSALLDLPVELGAPLGPLAADSVPADEDPARFTVAAGLALGATA